MSQHVIARAAPKLGAVARPSHVQSSWLRNGLAKPNGKLPLFDSDGQRISDRTIQSCVRLGWAKPWFNVPLKKNWTVCTLTHLGRVVAEED